MDSQQEVVMFFCFFVFLTAGIEGNVSGSIMHFTRVQVKASLSKIFEANNIESTLLKVPLNAKTSKTDLQSEKSKLVSNKLQTMRGTCIWGQSVNNQRQGRRL